jgi:hypothetical protein
VCIELLRGVAVPGREKWMRSRFIWVNRLVEGGLSTDAFRYASAALVQAVQAVQAVRAVRAVRTPVRNS